MCVDETSTTECVFTSTKRLPLSVCSQVMECIQKYCKVSDEETLTRYLGVHFTPVILSGDGLSTRASGSMARSTVTCFDLKHDSELCRDRNCYRDPQYTGRVVREDRSRQRHSHWSGGPVLLLERMEHTHCGRRFVDGSLDVPFSSSH